MKRSLIYGVILFFTISLLLITNFPPSKNYCVPTKPISTYNSIPTEVEFCINQACDKYKIPHYIAYNMAYKETSYRGPKDESYRHNRTSSCGALGVLQIMPSTANFIKKEKIDKHKLKNDISYNIDLGLKYLSYLHKKYKRWDIALGYYNTGYPKVNSYSSFIMKNTDYKQFWIN